MSASSFPKHTASAIVIAFLATFFAVSSVSLYSLTCAVATETLAADWTGGISAQRHFEHVYFMASDSLKGRGNGTLVWASIRNGADEGDIAIFADWVE